MSADGHDLDAWFVVWLGAVREAYKLAYGRRLAQLRGKRIKSFDDRGLHPYSEAWGRIIFAEDRVGAMWPYASIKHLSPESLRRMAEQDAYHEFITTLREESAE